jgi:predicted nucleotidyltransferase
LAALLAAWRDNVGDQSVLLVGAAARDLLLVHVHRVAVFRATEDTDLAVAIPDWAAFKATRDARLNSGRFKPGGPEHRLWFGGHRVDVVPFGGVERKDRRIVWPAPAGEVMNVWGFSEAMESAVTVNLSPEVAVKVASLPALALLKLSAWRERHTETSKDAADLWLLLRHYAEAGNEDRLFGPEGIGAMTAFGFDLDRAGAWLLGRDARAVLDLGAEPKTALAELNSLLEVEIDPAGPLRMIGQMAVGDRERQLLLVTAFHSGLLGGGLTV